MLNINDYMINAYRMIYNVDNLIYSNFVIV